MIVAETPNGKGIKIVQIQNSSLYGVTFADGGELPPELKGRWTSPDLAKKEIDKYINKLEGKKSTNGKSTGR